MTSCSVCGVRTLKTREPLARTCHRCGKDLCNAHTHFYVDGQNAAITKAAPPQCATCSGMVTIHCLVDGCPQIIEHRDPEQGSAVMQAHQDSAHGTDSAPAGHTAPEVILPAEAGDRGLAAYWASRALLGDYGPLCDEDREMADAAYARAMDVQLGVAGKGTHKTLRECFPIGDVTRREDEERDATEATPEDGALLTLHEVTRSTAEESSR